jgi:hypothetical protein
MVSGAGLVLIGQAWQQRVENAVPAGTSPVILRRETVGDAPDRLLLLRHRLALSVIAESGLAGFQEK